LDSVRTATLFGDLIGMGLATQEEQAAYGKAINYVYNRLEEQIEYPEAGYLQQHAQKDGVPTQSFSKWNIVLDGIYMSQTFLVRLADLIDSGKVSVTSLDGHAVTSGEIWDKVYSRLRFAYDHMRDPETGLMYHAYSIELAENNRIAWGRGMGWYTLVLLEAAENMPDPERRADLENMFRDNMDALLEWQDPETHLWYNLINMRTEEVAGKNQVETSGSAMFTYCLLQGFNDGILTDAKYKKAGLAAFNSMVETRMTDEGLTDTLLGMGPTDVAAYYSRNTFATNEAKGVGPLIMAATAAEVLSCMK
jgi:unsaturated rhamnogalacturonyl hydrolase